MCASIFLGHLDPGSATRTRGSTTWGSFHFAQIALPLHPQFLWEGLRSYWYTLVTFLWSLLTLKPCRNFETSHLKPKCLHFPAYLDRVSCVSQGIWPQASGDYLSISRLAISIPGLQDVPHHILFVLGLLGDGGARLQSSCVHDICCIYWSISPALI